MLKISIVGISGRIGTILSKMVNDSKDEYIFTGGINSGIDQESKINFVQNADVIIDFSTPVATLESIALAHKHRKPYVCGTTGFSTDDLKIMESYFSNVPILLASNFSICVQLLSLLIKKCSEVLLDFDASIIDIHHKNKKDSPSGTAIFLAQNILQKPDISSIRAGGVFGEHCVNFIGENEMISLSHKAFNREIFAEGALNCAKWLVTQKPGLYSMQDFLESITTKQFHDNPKYE